MTLSIGFEFEARFRNQGFFADAGEYVLQGAARRVVVEHVIGGDERGFVRAGNSGGVGQAGFIAAIVTAGQGDIEWSFQVLLDVSEVFDVGVGQGEDHAMLVFTDIFKGDVAFPLDGAALAQGEQAAQTAIGGAGCGVAE